MVRVSDLSWSHCVQVPWCAGPDAYQPHYVPIPFRTSLTMSQSRFAPASLCPNPVSCQPHYVPIPFRTSLTMYQSCHLPATLCTSPVSYQPHYVLIPLTKYQSRSVPASVSINNRFVPTSLCTNPPPPHYVHIPFRTSLTVFQFRRVPDSTDHSNTKLCAGAPRTQFQFQGRVDLERKHWKDFRCVMSYYYCYYR